MFKSYHDKVCIVTGSSAGIGAAFARELASQGAKVVLFARRAEQLDSVKDSLVGEGHLCIVGDVTLAEDRARLLEETLSTYGRVDALINNAGRGDGRGGFADKSPETIESVMQINLVCAIHLTRAVMPTMIEQKSGLIINISSPMGQLNLPGFPLYNSTKAGLSAFSHSLRREVSRHGVHVMDFAPGFTRSEMINPRAEAHLPKFVPVKEADHVAKVGLKMALKGKGFAMTGGMLVRLGTMINRMFPRVFDLAGYFANRRTDP
jgi:short-subunit dehydrogenase